MWTEYRDKSKKKETAMLAEELAKVEAAFRRGDPRPPKGAYLEHVIEVLWRKAATAKHPTYPTHD